MTQAMTDSFKEYIEIATLSLDRLLVVAIAQTGNDRKD